MEPLVSVILPIYKGEKHLKEAVDSILDQSYKNIELILINDCSPDKSMEAIGTIQDNRIIIITNPSNLGLVGALNIGIQNSKGEYIARMDQDDIAFPERLKKQVEFLEKEKRISIISSYFETFGTENQTITLPVKPREIELELYFQSALCHPLVMFRKKDVIKYKLLYNKDFKDIEDWNLWYTASKKGIQFANLTNVLLKYRLEGQSTTPQNKKIRYEQFSKMYQIIVKDIFGKENEQFAKLQLALSKGETFDFSPKKIHSYINLLTNKLVEKGYSKQEIKTVLFKKVNKLGYKFSDISLIYGLSFIFYQKLFTLQQFKYLLSKRIKKDKKTLTN